MSHCAVPVCHMFAQISTKLNAKLGMRLRARSTAKWVESRLCDVVLSVAASVWPKISKPLKVVQTRHNRLSNRSAALRRTASFVLNFIPTG